MYHLSKYLAVFLSAALATYLLVPLLKRIAPCLGLIDKPDTHRHLHPTPTPTGGGLAVFFGFHVGCFVLLVLPVWGSFGGSTDAIWWFRFLCMTSLLALFGLADDRWALSPVWKLLAQLAVSIWAYQSGMSIERIAAFTLPEPLDAVLTVLWFLAFMNAFNLIDGMDGLAAGLGAISATGLAFMFLFQGQPANTLIMLALIGSCLAFLRFNFSPATIYLGDCGSMFIGFTLAAVALSTSTKSSAMVAVGIPVMAVGVPVLDTLLAIWRRSVRRALHRDGADSVVNADTDHLHHRLAERGLTQRVAVGVLYGLNLAFVVVGVCLTVFSSHVLGIVLIAFVAGTYLVVRHLAYVELRASGELLALGLNRPPTHVVATLVYIPLDAMLMALALLVALVMVPPLPETWYALKMSWLRHVPLWVGVPFLSLRFGRTYRVVWSRAQPLEFVRLIVKVLAAIAVAAGLYSFQEVVTPAQLLRQAIVFAAVLLPGLVFTRLLSHVLHALAPALHGMGPGRGAPTERRVLVYGAGELCGLYMRSPIARSHRVVALFDEDRNLHGRFAYGIQILGGSDRIPGVLRAVGVDDIVVTEPLAPEFEAELRAIAGTHDVGVLVWQASLTEARVEAQG